MMDSSVSTPIPNKPKDDSQDKSTEDQNKKEISDNSCNTPVSEIEAPLSPVLTNSKKSLRHIARRKSRIKLMNKFSQNSLVSQETCTPLEKSQVEENELLTDDLKISVENLAVKTDLVEKENCGDNELEERMKRCLELQRNKKFCYKIAVNSSKILLNSKSNDSNCKISESSENISEIDHLKSIEPFVSNVNLTECNTESDFNFKIPESPVSLSKSKKSNTIKVRTDSATNSKQNINLNIGFETGSGKKINLSEKAIKRAAKLFDDIIDTPEQSEVLSNYEKLEDIKIDTSFNKNENHNNKVFKISGGNSSKLSENSAKKAQSLFDDIFDLSNESQNEPNSANEVKLNQKLQNVVDETKSSTNTETKHPTQFKIPPQQIENKSIYKPNQVLSPENKTFSFTQITDTQMYSAAENAECLSEFILNTQWTPSPKDKSQDPKIQLSNEKKISKSQDDEFVSPESDQFFGNLTVCEDGTVATRNNESNSGIHENSDKKVTITEESINKVENISVDCDVDKNSEIRFSTASGKNVTISEESLIKARNILEDDFIEENTKKYSAPEKKTKNMFDDCDFIEENINKNIFSDKTSIGFSTASGKKLSVSKESLKKVENIFQDCDIISDITEENIQKNSFAEIMTAGFSTASGKKVSISEESLKEAKNIFQDCDIVEDNTEKNIVSELVTSGFSTVCGEKILISEESLNKAKNIFEECDLIEKNTEKKCAPENIKAEFSRPSDQKLTVSKESLKKVENMFEDSIIEESSKNNLTTQVKSIISDDKIELNKELSAELSTGHALKEEHVAETSMQSGFLTASGKKIVISEEVLNKVRNIFEDPSDLNKEIPEEEMFEFTTPFANITILEESIKNSNNLEISESNEQSQQNCTATPEKNTTCTFCGFTWDESLISYKIYERYKRSFTCIEKYIKENVLHPFIFTFDTVQASKQYKNKNYKYALRFKKKSSVIYGGAKSKSSRSQRNAVKNSPKTPELLNTSNIVTRSRSSLTIEDTSPSLIANSLPKPKSRKRKSEDNFNIDSSNQNISSASNKSNSENKSSVINIEKNININKTIEDLEDAFLSYIENTLKETTNKSQESNTTDTFLSTEEMNSLKENFSLEPSFNTSPDIKGNSINSETEKSIRVAEKNKIDVNNLENMIVKEEIVEKTKHVFNKTNENLKNNITPKNNKSVFIEESNKDNILETSSETKNIVDDINNFNFTPTNDLKFGFLNPVGKKITATEEDLKKSKNIFQDCDVAQNESNINLSTPNIENKLAVLNSVTEENIETPKNESSIGFVTASGKQVAISEDALKKAKNIFEDCDITEENVDKNIDTSKNASSFGFATASGKKVTISEDALQKAKNIFQDYDIGEDNIDNNIETPKSTLSLGFATASGKKVAISEDALKKAKNIFEDCDITEENVDKNIDTSKNASSFGFATASGKKVTISEDALKKAKNIFQDCDIGEDNIDNVETPKSTLSLGFATASGKKVAISEDALEKAKNIFQDCDINKENIDKNLDTPKHASSFGFAIASGRKVAISENAVEKAKNIFQDCNIGEENIDKNLDTPKHVSSFGFATASGKKVPISEDAIKKAKNIFQDCDIGKENIDNNLDTPKNVPSFGFATASGKKVTISENALQKAKNIFQDCDIGEDNIDNNIETPKSTLSLGFATASGRKVAIFEDALKKAKNIFQDCDIGEENIDKNLDTPKNVSSFGFATASGRKVTVSEDALQKAKNIFQDCDINKENIDKNLDTPKHVSSFGFATASGKKVTISEDALKKAKDIFEDCDIGKENIDNNLDTPKLVSSFGFATASGKKVAISEDAMQKVKNIFQDCDIGEENVDNNLDTPKHVSSLGFATALGRKVSISEEALQKAKNLFQDCDIAEENIDTPIAKSFGFDTASGKKVVVSKEELEKAKTMFEEISETNISTPKTSLIDEFSSASGKKVTVSETGLKRARNIFEDVETEVTKEDLKNECASTSISEKPFKKMRSISECEENKSTINTPKNINQQSAAVTSKSYSSPQISPNVSTPILRKKTLSIRNSKKRSLGVTPCKQIDIPENSLKRAKLVFDDVETPKKTETTINNNNLQSYSPLINKTNNPVVKTPLNFVSKSSPTISTQSKSLLNSNISMKESNQIKSSQNLVTPKISPLKNIGNENKDENLSFVFQERTIGDIKKWNTDLQKEIDILKLKMSVVETRMMMLNEQQEIIETGSSDHRRQRPGSLFTQKLNNNRLTLKEAVNNRRPEKNTHQICLKTGLDPSLLEITSENSSNLHFHVPWWTNDNRTYPAVIRTEDGAVVIPNQQNYVGITEIERAFLAMPGIDPSLVPKKWVSNHYRWIVWKLASLERNFPDVFKNCLSVESVISQLKYRYDREIDRAQRPAIRKIVECDDTAAKRMVLCVATVIKLAENKYELELTDGWYSIKTMLDIPLNNLVERNVIKNGMKLITQGAELLNCEGCDPLELPANVRLQIHYNSTRRAAWHAKLGYQPNPGPLRISLRMISGNGGPIGAVSSYVARLYPISFMERCDVAIIWRNQRAELRRANQWEASYANMMETIQICVQEELEKEWAEREKKNKNKRIKIKDVSGVNCGRTLYQFIEDSNDPDTVKELLTADQISALQDYQTELNIERQSELTTRLRQKLSNDKIKPRNVSIVLKLLLVDVHSPYHHRMLSIWRPTEAHTQLLKEGIVINIYNVTAKNNGTLSSIPRTQFDINCNIDTTKFENTNRFVIPISQISNPSLKPQFGEFDTVGMVVTIDVQPTAQTLWLADETYRFLVVKVREGPETCSLFDGISPGKIVAAMNLIYQKPFKFYGQAVGNHYTVLSSYPQQPYLQDFMQEFIENLSAQTENIDQYLEECKNRVEELSSQNLKRGYVLNPLNVNHSEEEIESLSKKLCGVESTQPNKCDSLTLSDEEMALIDTQLM